VAKRTQHVAPNMLRWHVAIVWPGLNACEANEEMQWQDEDVFHSLDETGCKFQRLLLLNL